MSQPLLSRQWFACFVAVVMKRTIFNIPKNELGPDGCVSKFHIFDSVLGSMNIGDIIDEIQLHDFMLPKNEMDSTHFCVDLCCIYCASACTKVIQHVWSLWTHTGTISKHVCIYICTCLYMFMHIYTHNVRNNLDLVFKHMRHLLSYHPVSTRYWL